MGATPTPRYQFREVIQLLACKSGAFKQAGSDDWSVTSNGFLATTINEVSKWATASTLPYSEKARVGFHLSPKRMNLRKSLEARVGIEPKTPRLRVQNARFCGLIKQTLSLPEPTRLNSFSAHFGAHFNLTTWVVLPVGLLAIGLSNASQDAAPETMRV